MNFIVLDKQFIPLTLADTYVYAIWTERFATAGDFELELPIHAETVQYMEIGNYLTLEDSETAMIIESMKVNTDVSNGARTIVYKGESLEAILKRRIVWNQTVLNGTLINCLATLFRQNLGADAAAARRITNFVFDTRQYFNRPEFNFTIQAQFTGDTLYDAVSSMCEACGLGWRIRLLPNGTFNFELYAPTDRSGGDPDVDPVIFSPEFDNLLNSRYLYDTMPYKNITLVMGEGEGGNRKRRTVWVGLPSGDPEPSGLDRRELYTDARDLQSETSGGGTMSDADYNASLDYRGYKKLAENTVSAAFDGQLEPSIGAIFGTDYVLGDYVLAMNDYGMGSATQVYEYIRTYDSGGFKAYPTFKMVA